MAYLGERRWQGLGAPIAGDVLGIGGAVQGIGTIAQAIPGFLTAIGENKGQEEALEAQERARRENLAAQVQLAEINARASESRWASIDRAVRAAAPWIGVTGALFATGLVLRRWWNGGSSRKGRR